MTYGLRISASICVYFWVHMLVDLSVTRTKVHAQKASPVVTQTPFLNLCTLRVRVLNKSIT